MFSSEPSLVKVGTKLGSKVVCFHMDLLKKNNDAFKLQCWLFTCCLICLLCHLLLQIRHPEKIFKNPGSVSYRRLLPYLMEAADVTRDVDMKDPKNEGGESMAAKDRILETRPVLHGNIIPLKKMPSTNTTKISV